MNRGVEKRQIFMDDQDRRRFVAGLELFNDMDRVDKLARTINSSPVRLRKSDKIPLVQIHGWCLMHNHYHLLISEAVEGGMTKFLMKLNIGYSKYFNARYKRSGTLFQSRTKKVLVERDAHFLYILHYIHLNPLDQLHATRGWRKKKLQNVAAAMNHLCTYRWSSYSDYCGHANFPDLLTTSLFQDVFKNYEGALRTYICDLELSEIKTLLLE